MGEGKSNRFLTAFIILVSVCTLLTLAHIIYIAAAYPNSSIIYFVNMEM